MGRKQTLQRQFNTQLFIIVISIIIASVVLIYVYLNHQVEQKIELEAELISQSIVQGIKATDLASNEIEHQIDKKLEVIIEQISNRLPEEVDQINNELLIESQEEMGISGISIFSYDEDDIVSVTKSTEPDELGFTLKGVNDNEYQIFEDILQDEIPDLGDEASYQEGNTFVFYTAQAGSREGEPQFFKYAYHKAEGTDYFISIFLEANEVYQFTQKVGPESWIEEVSAKSPYTKEIAVLDSRVFKDPSLAEQMYPPLRKVKYGEYNYKTDDQLLIDMIGQTKKETRLEEHNGTKIYKSFTPFDDHQVIYVAMNYEKMMTPMKHQIYFLIGMSVLALVVLYVITTRFFNNIYQSIQKIIQQIRVMEKGDFTVKSNVKDKGELGSLSQSINKLANTLNSVLSETNKEAIKTERHAYLLESEANNSVDKVYTMSMAATTNAREQSNELNYLIDQVEHELNSKTTNDEKVLADLAKIRQYIQEHSNSTTDMTITLSDLLKSLHSQSESLSGISKKLLKNLEQFKLDANNKLD